MKDCQQCGAPLTGNPLAVSWTCEYCQAVNYNETVVENHAKNIDFSKAHNLLRVAMAAYEGEDYATAVATFEKVLAEDSASIDAWTYAAISAAHLANMSNFKMSLKKVQSYLKQAETMQQQSELIVVSQDMAYNALGKALKAAVQEYRHEAEGKSKAEKRAVQRTAAKPKNVFDAIGKAANASKAGTEIKKESLADVAAALDEIAALDFFIPDSRTSGELGIEALLCLREAGRAIGVAVLSKRPTPAVEWAGTLLANVQIINPKLFSSLLSQAPWMFRNQITSLVASINRKRPVKQVGNTASGQSGSSTLQGRKKMSPVLKGGIGCLAVIVIFPVVVGIFSAIQESKSTTPAASSTPAPQPVPTVKKQPPAPAAKKADAAQTNAKADSSDTKTKIITRPAPTASIQVDAETMDKEFNANRLAFDRKYKGKVVAIRGVVGKVMAGTSGPEVGIEGTSGLFQTKLICCAVQPSESTLAEQLDEGDKVLVVGECTEAGESIFGPDYINIKNSIIAEMPDKSDKIAKASQDASSSPLTLKQLAKEIEENEPRAMAKYKGKRVLFQAQWDNVKQADDGSPELNLTSLLTGCSATCTLRKDQTDAAAQLDLEKEIIIDTIFDGGDCGFTGFQFRDGILSTGKGRAAAQPSPVSNSTSSAHVPSKETAKSWEGEYILAKPDQANGLEWGCKINISAKDAVFDAFITVDGSENSYVIPCIGVPDGQKMVIKYVPWNELSPFNKVFKKEEVLLTIEKHADGTLVTHWGAVKPGWSMPD